jgi:hypothetical protein
LKLPKHHHRINPNIVLPRLDGLTRREPTDSQQMVSLSDVLEKTNGLIPLTEPAIRDLLNKLNLWALDPLKSREKFGNEELKALERIDFSNFNKLDLLLRSIRDFEKDHKPDPLQRKNKDLVISLKKNPKISESYSPELQPPDKPRLPSVDNLRRTEEPAATGKPTQKKKRKTERPTKINPIPVPDRKNTQEIFPPPNEPKEHLVQIAEPIHSPPSMTDEEYKTALADLIARKQILTSKLDLLG